MSTPRAQRCTRGTPCSSSCSTESLDGASVRSARECSRRTQRHAARAPMPKPYAAANPAMSVW